MTSSIDAILDVVFTPASELDDLTTILAGKNGEEVDYHLEAQLEELAKLLASDAANVAKTLDKRGKSMTDLAEALQEVWLEGEVPRCGAELKVRAAEALGVWSVAVKEPKADVILRMKSKNFEQRMWAARAVRAADWDDADALLADLAKDPYEDDNGFFLVREAAGFTD